MLRHLQPHIPGLIYTGLVIVVGVAAMNNQNNLLFWVLGVMLSGLVISAFLSNVMMHSLVVRRIDPQHGSVGEPLIVRYAITNRSRLFSAFDIHLEEKSATGERSWRRLMKPSRAWVMHIGPRETVHGEAIFWPTRRGEAAFDRVRLSTSFPFGIVRKSRTIAQPQHTLIFPMMYELRRGVLNKITPAGLMGMRISQHAGAGDDYYGVREYRLGDSLRHIAWKRTAQNDELVTIERTSPSPAKLRVILDLTNPTEKLHVEPRGIDAARDLEEQAISLAASIIHAADMNGYEVGLTVLGFDAIPIAVRRNQWHLRKIMAALAEIDLHRQRSQRRSQLLRDAERAGIVVVAPDRVQPMTGREDAMYLTARQHEGLAVRPIGWDPSRFASRGPSQDTSDARTLRGHADAAA